jgi:hypothetical protein
MEMIWKGICFAFFFLLMGIDRLQPLPSTLLVICVFGLKTGLDSFKSKLFVGLTIRFCSVFVLILKTKHSSSLSSPSSFSRVWCLCLMKNAAGVRPGLWERWHIEVEKGFQELIDAVWPLGC